MSYMYKAIIFDFFGVIQADPYQRWLSKHGLKREGPFAKVSNAVDKSLITQQEFYNTLSGLSGDSIQNIKDAFNENKLIDEELVKLVNHLRTDYKIGLLSNSSGGYLRPILNEHGIADLFNEVIISSEAGIIKPDPRIFELALEKLESSLEKRFSLTITATTPKPRPQ